MGDIIREEEEALLDSSLLAETPSITLNRLSQSFTENSPIPRLLD
jgi:hypothetical protein